MIDLVALQTSLDALNVRLDDVAGSLVKVERGQKRGRRIGWAALIIGALLAAALILGVVDNRRAIEANNKLWCPVLSIVGSNDPPRETDAGRTMVTEIYRLGHRPAYGCW